MANKFYVLTDKGFLQPSNLKGRDILLSSGLYKKHIKDFNINKNFNIKEGDYNDE